MVVVLIANPVLTAGLAAAAGRPQVMAALGSEVRATRALVLEAPIVLRAAAVARGAAAVTEMVVPEWWIL
jgi:hypothetical protein